jgi:hypothetical protein
MISINIQNIDQIIYIFMENIKSKKYLVKSQP